MMQDAAEAEWVRCPHPVLQQTYHSGGTDTAHVLVDCEVCHGPTRVDTCTHAVENEHLRAIIEVREGVIASLQSIELAEIERLRATVIKLEGKLIYARAESRHLRERQRLPIESALQEVERLRVTIARVREALAQTDETYADIIMLVEHALKELP